MVDCHVWRVDCHYRYNVIKKEFDIVIIGGGIVGATLACAIASSNLRIAVIDFAKPQSFNDQDYDLRVSAITLGSKSIFETIGAWTAMTQRRVSCVDAMEIWDEGGSGHIRFNSDELAQPCLTYIVENRVILQALLDRMNSFHNIEYMAPIEVENLSTNDRQVIVMLKNGDALQTKVLIGADGANSLVRELSGIQFESKSFNQKAIVATVKTEQEHGRVARQRFMVTGPLAFLPLDDANLCSIVWSVDNDRADALMALDDTAFNVELQTAFGNPLGKVQLAGQRAMFPLVSAHAKQYLAQRIVLAGDAAHRIHPLAGQGLNLGLEDVAVLAEVLVEAHQSKLDIGAHKTLRRYERWRKGSNALMLATMDGFKRTFGSNNDVVRSLRNFGLDITDGLPALKNQIIQYASGQRGDLPKLMRGLHL